MKKSRGVLVLLFMLLAGAFLSYSAVFGIGEHRVGAADNIRLGLDLAGGVSITYETVEENPTAEQMSDTVYKLQKRVEEYSPEAQVYQEGSNRINIEIPGVEDANAILQELGKPGSLVFQEADGTVILEGTDIAGAEAQIVTDQAERKNYIVELTLTEEGAEKFEQATEENLGKQLPIVYDGEVISAPTVESVISGGVASITNMKSYEEAEQLASTIRIGSLQLELTELRSNVVGAQLGEDAIKTSLQAGAIGFVLVVLFMIAVYLLPGFASALALAIYVGLMLFVLNVFEITLTLPGIAGIILSIGMAVDANVIIFARIREELATGKTVRSSMKIGFQKALSAIVDGNVTTLIAAGVLAYKGSGSVKGFAQTLALGIILSMFTALVVTRLILNALYALGMQSERIYGAPKETTETKRAGAIDFLGKKNICFVLSALVILSGIAAMGIQAGRGAGALNYSLEFKGGTSTSVTFLEDYSIEELESQVKPVIAEVIGSRDIQAQKVSGTNQVIFKTQELNLETREALNLALAEHFGVDEAKITAESISSTISSEVRMDALVSVLIATVCMLLYIWVRFQDIRFAASAVLALVHDVLVVLAFYAIARISVGSNFIACMLTIVGYSINATIVIFDRIRENMKDTKKRGDLKELVNLSITQTLTRSIYTSLTTFIMVAALYALGVASIREFALPLMVGIVCGAYSSVCLTGALWYLMKKRTHTEL